MSALDFSPPPRKRARESVVPMINVVFLLLIFFLMSAQIAPPDPVDVLPPVVRHADAPLPEDARQVWLGRDGVLHHDGLTDAAAQARLADDPGPVSLRADAALPAADLARTLRLLAEAGLTEITLVATPGEE